MITISDMDAGKAGEYIVCADLILAGVTAFPSDQALPFDVVADVNGRLIKIQVKTTRGPRQVPQRIACISSYLFNIKQHGKNKSRIYQAGDVDIFALVALDTKEIGYIPALEVKQTMCFRCPHLESQYHNNIVAARDAQIPILRAEGKQFKEIAEILGVHISYAHRTYAKGRPVEKIGRTLSDFTFTKAIQCL
jgi:hypothetical protein